MTPTAFPRRGLGRWWAGQPLRLRLVAALVALVALGLLATGVTATASLRGYLLDRVDAQLAAAVGPTAQGLVAGREDGRPRRGRLDFLSSFYVLRSDVAGAPVDELRGPPRARVSVPDLPRLDLAAARARAGRPFSVGSVKAAGSAGDDGPAGSAGSGGDRRWRVVVVPLPDASGSIALASDLGEVDATVARLRRTALVIGLAVLALLALLARAVVRSSLRPLTEVEATAAAIAGGDLTRRVPSRDPRTEVGRLGLALNAMLGQVESAFAARTASEARARGSEERMRRFVADASHELRTPLTSIRGFAELYRQGAADDPAQVLRRVEDAATRMGLLVDELLLLARLDEQRPLDRSPVDLLALAADAVHDASALDPGRPVTLRVSDGPPPVVAGDEARLRQVLGNLVTNALVHTPRGTPVAVDVGVQGGVAVVEVVDRGPGLTAEQSARVFERFYRVDAARSRARGGSGLGLSIVSSIVAAHGGRVSVASRPGEGATFRVELPLAAAAGAAATPAASRTDRAPAGQGGAGTGAGTRTDAGASVPAVPSTVPAPRP